MTCPCEMAGQHGPGCTCTTECIACYRLRPGPPHDTFSPTLVGEYARSWKGKDDKFPARIVLGEGWPHPEYTGPNYSNPTQKRMLIGLDIRRRDRELMPLIDQETTALLCDDDCPKYRLVLERVEP